MVGIKPFLTHLLTTRKEAIIPATPHRFGLFQ